MILVYGTILFLSIFMVLLIIESRKSTVVYIQDVKPKYDYEAIKYGAYQKAIMGDKAAREWCEDNIFTVKKKPYVKPIPPLVPKRSTNQSPTKTVTEKSFVNNQQVIQDSISALVNLGMKKTEAKQKVMSIYSSSNNTVESIVKAAFRR